MTPFDRTVFEKINRSFQSLPHLRLVAAALYALKDEPLLRSGDVEGFEHLITTHPLYSQHLGDCRTFLKAFCPHRYPHTHHSWHWQAVLMEFSRVSKLLEAAHNPFAGISICVDAESFITNRRRPGKRAFGATAAVANLMTEYAKEAGFEVLSEKLGSALCVGVTALLGPAFTVQVEASPTAQELAQRYAELVEGLGVSVVPTSDAAVVRPLLEESCLLGIIFTFPAVEDATDAAVREHALAKSLVTALEGWAMQNCR